MIQRTVVFPIHLDRKQAEAVLKTIKLYFKAWKYCVDIAWDMKKLSSVDLHKVTYNKLKAELCLKSQYLCSARNRAVESVKSVRTLSKKGKKISKPTSDQIPIRLDARTLSFDKLREKVSITTQDGRIKIPLVWHKQANRYKEWHCKAGEIGINKAGKFVLRLIFEKEQIKPKRTQRVVGVDRGIRHAVVSSDNRFIGKRKWREHERKLLSLRAKLQFKGTKSSKKHLKTLSGRLRRFKKDCDHTVAKQLISKLLPGDTIVLEKLTNIRQRCGEKGKAVKKHRANMARWSFKRLEDYAISVAQLNGVYVEYIQPHYTSQTCSSCDIILKKNRKSQSFYSCSCGLKLNADLNAARNISKKWCCANGVAFGLSVNQPIVVRCF